MVVSGLPRRNGITHAGEIATLALKLLEIAYMFHIPHLPSQRMLLRIGIHSGIIYYYHRFRAFLFNMKYIFIYNKFISIL